MQTATESSHAFTGYQSMADDFQYDVLSHSAKDKDVVRDIANRRRAYGVRV